MPLTIAMKGAHGAVWKKNMLTWVKCLWSQKVNWNFSFLLISSLRCVCMYLSHTKSFQGTWQHHCVGIIFPNSIFQHFTHQAWASEKFWNGFSGLWGCRNTLCELWPYAKLVGRIKSMRNQKCHKESIKKSHWALCLNRVPKHNPKYRISQK